MNNRTRFEEAWGCDIRRSNALLVAHQLQADGFEGEFHNNMSNPIYFKQDEDQIVPNTNVMAAIEFLRGNER